MMARFEAPESKVDQIDLSLLALAKPQRKVRSTDPLPAVAS